MSFLWFCFLIFLCFIPTLVLLLLRAYAFARAPPVTCKSVHRLQPPWFCCLTAALAHLFSSACCFSWGTCVRGDPRHRWLKLWGRGRTLCTVFYWTTPLSFTVSFPCCSHIQMRRWRCRWPGSSHNLSQNTSPVLLYSPTERFRLSTNILALIP